MNEISHTLHELDSPRQALKTPKTVARSSQQQQLETRKTEQQEQLKPFDLQALTLTNHKLKVQQPRASYLHEFEEEFGQSFSSETNGIWA